MPDFFTPTQQDPTWGDTLDLFQAGAWSVGSGLAGLARSNADNPAYGARMKEFQLYFNQKRDANTGEMTEAGRAQAFSDFGSEEFWKSPVGWGVAQLAGASPYILATVIPVAATGGLSGVAMGAGMAGLLTAGDVTSGVQETVDRMSDEELSEKSLGFADDILSGKSSEEARNNLINTMLGHKQAMALALGVGSGLLGIPRIAGGAIGRVLGRETAKIPQATGGFLKGGAKEGGLGAVSEYAEEFGASVLGQEAQIAGGFQDELDIGRAHAAGMTGAVVGGVVGGALGAVERAGKGGEKRTAHTAIPSTAPPPASVQAATEPQAGFPSALRGPEPILPQAGFPSPLTGPTGAPPVSPPGAGPTPPPVQPAGAIPENRAVTLQGNMLPADPEARIPGTALALRGGTEPTVLSDPLSPAGDVKLALAAKAPAMLPPPSRAMGAIPEARVPPQQPVAPPSAVPPSAPVPPANVPPPGAIPTPETRTPEQVIPTVPPLRPNVPPAQPVPPTNTPPMQPVPPPGVRPMQPVPPPANRPMQPVPPTNVPPPGQMPSRQLATVQRRPIGPTPVRPTPDVIPMRPSPYAARPDVIALPPPSDRAVAQGAIALPPPPVRRAPVVRRPAQPPTKKTGRILRTERPMSEDEEALFDRALEEYERRGGGLVTTDLLDYAMKRDFIERAKRRRAGLPEEEPTRVAAPITAEERKALGMERVRTGKKGPEVKAKIKADEEKAKELFDRHTPDPKAKLETKEQVQARVKVILDDAKDVKIPDRVEEVHSDELVWLVEAKKLNQAFNARKRSVDKMIQSFLFRERAFKSGMGEEARAERKQEAGQERELVGSPENVVSPQMLSEEEITRRETEHELTGEEIEPEEDTFIPARAKPSRVAKESGGYVEGTVRPGTFRGKKRTYPVIRMPITDEMRAKYETPGRVLPSKVTEPEPTLPPKVEAIVAKTKTAKERLATALRRIDRKATPDQIRAGNAKVGLFNIHGLQLAIQYARGMVRSGTSREGQTWQQRMTAHYGHIKGTKGADGQPIDIYIGSNPDADTVFVVDQRNPDTHEFDEHKVMLGFKDADAALTAYHGAFGDGSGPARTGDVTPMTVPEFQAWVAEKTITDPAGMPVDDPEAVLLKASSKRAVSEPEILPPMPTAATFREKMQSYGLNSVGYGPILSDMLSEGRFAHLNPFFQRIANLIAPRIADVPVYSVTTDQMIDLFGSDVPAFYNPTEDAIFFREDAFDHPNALQIMMHEGVHAAFLKAMYMNDNIRQTMTYIASEFKDALVNAGRWRDFYAFQDVDEFIAEALSNISMQQELSNLKAPDHLRNFMAANRTRSVGSKLRTLWDAVRISISHALRIPLGKSYDSFMDAVLQTTAELHFTLQSNPPGALTADQSIEYAAMTQDDVDHPDSPWSPTGQEIQFGKAFSGSDFKKVTDYLPEGVRPREGEPQSRVWMLGLRSMDGIAQMAKDFGAKFGAAARRVANAHERIRVARQEEFAESEPLLKNIADMKKKYIGPRWDQFTNFLHDETMAQVYGDRSLDTQKHLGKNRLSATWAKEQYSRLSAEYAKVPSDLRALRKEMLEYSKKQQETMSWNVLRNVVIRSMADPAANAEALAKKIFNKEELTEAEVKSLGGPIMFNHIRRAKELGRIAGPYYPLMRFGEFLVSGKYKITAPSDAELVSGTDNSFEFSGDNARERAQAYARKQADPTRTESVWVDPETGERYFEELDEEGTFREIKAGPKKEGSEQRYRVTIQNEHVQYFETLKDAQVEALELKKDPSFVIDHLEARRYNPNEGGQGRELMSHELKQVLDNMEKRPSWEGLTSESKRETQQTIRELSLRMFGTTRVQSRALPRRRVIGASKDFDKVFLQYAQSTSGYIAKLKHKPELDAALTDLDGLVNTDPEGGTKVWNARRDIANEMTRRIQKTQTQAPPNNLDVNINRITTLSFVNYLMSPAYSINNALQVGMLAYPQLAAKYGSGKAARMLLKAYADMGVGRVIKAGALTTAKAVRGGPQRTNFLEEALQKIHDTGERQMLQFLRENGSIAPDAGLEMDRMIGATVGDKALDHLQHIARAMPAAVETINRVTTALAAYRLEMQRTGNHQQATIAAQEMVNLTQGNYSSTNMPSFFNHPAGRITFQFKKYGQTVYGMLGHNIGKILRNANPGDRAEGAKALALVAATHVVMAGALGLPTEPIRWLVTAANLAGLTETKWEDVEHWERQLMASMFGKTAGELVSRGLPRALGIDVSERIGMANLMTFGAPRSNDEHSLQAYLGDLLGGAPGGMAIESLRGMNELFNGEDPIGAVQKMIPAKVISDTLGAFRMATEGRQTAAGYQVVEPTGLMTNMVRAIGFRPAREAEISERREYFFSVNARVTEQRNKFQRRWKEASPNEKTRLWGEIEQFNRGQPRGARLTRSQLEDYKKRRRGEEVIDGFRVTRTNRGLLNSLMGVYATE